MTIYNLFYNRVHPGKGGGKHIIAYFTATVISVIGAIEDASHRRIPNILVLIGYIIGVSITVQVDPKGLLPFLFRVLWPILILYPLFYTKMMGAGDIKLISALSGLLGTKMVFSVIILAFLTGAGISCYRVLSQRDLWTRLLNFKYYMVSCLCQKKILKYSTINKNESYINFGTCILLGLVGTFIWRVIG